jgi:hypothetical protein
MKILASVTRLALASALVIGASVPAFAEYKFQIHNNTDQKIRKVLVSEDGKEYGYFDIGAGIKSGATVNLVWAEETEGENCEQYFKAVFESGYESEPVAFDFCEADVALEFDFAGEE